MEMIYIILIFLLIILVIVIVQSAIKKTGSDADNAQYENWEADPANWKWGVFYYNPLDNRLWLPKRIKQFGWTINFAHPNCIRVFLIIIASAILIGLIPLAINKFF